MGHTQRSNKGLGVINQIVNIWNQLFSEKRNPIFAIPPLEFRSMGDEILLTKILDCDGKTSNANKYFELGSVPVRFERIKRKFGFLKYILKQDKTSMMSQVLKATCDNSVKNEFVYRCKKYLETLKTNISFDEIETMSKYKFKKFLKEKTKSAAFEYLEGQKNKQETKNVNLLLTVMHYCTRNID